MADPLRVFWVAQVKASQLLLITSRSTAETQDPVAL